MALPQQVDPTKKIKGNSATHASSANLEWSANVDLGALLIKMSSS